MTGQKTLYILRHAKAETGSSYKDDHERGVTPRGIEAAETMGQYFQTQGVRPEKILCSTAVRARETLAHLQKIYAREVPVEYSDRLYLASVNETNNLVGQISETVSRLLVVGHNPGLHQFCLQLVKSGEASLMDTLAIKFPTCAFATIALGNVAWKDIAHVKGDLKGFVTPSMLAHILEE